MILLTLFLILIWTYFLYIFKKNRLTAFYYMIGSFGFFILGLTFFFKPLTKFLSFITLSILDIISSIFNYFEVYINYNMIFINYKESAISLYMNYECSGLIEVLVLFSAIVFYPLFTKKQKIFNLFIGFIWTCLSNIIRLLFIIFYICMNGNSSYYIAHSYLGRIIFYVLTIVMYFYMFSFTQISKQKVGKFKYNSIKNNKIKG